MICFFRYASDLVISVSGLYGRFWVGEMKTSLILSKHNGHSNRDFLSNSGVSTVLRDVLLLTASVLSIALSPEVYSRDYIVVQSTTSTQSSGFYDALLPQFEAHAGFDVRVVAVGTGQAIRNAKSCDADVLLVHAKDAETEFVDSGHGLIRHDLMYNDFIVVGPSKDPAGVLLTDNVIDALTAISTSRVGFASRGDDSGTHRKEQALWDGAGIDVNLFSGKWYRETGSGMGATLNSAVAMGSYTLTDRATWVAFANKASYKVLFQHDPLLFNQYGITVVNPERCPSVELEKARYFVEWLLSEEGQLAIGRVEKAGQALFVPNAEGDH